ncbi:hypothetical protein FGB62_87g052 [Gracilaria domingensis]|nr:hypothetical protein FGB62_87g052 [Gracilaria domingensis]
MAEQGAQQRSGGNVGIGGCADDCTSHGGKLVASEMRPALENDDVGGGARLPDVEGSCAAEKVAAHDGDAHLVGGHFRAGRRMTDTVVQYQREGYRYNDTFVDTFVDTLEPQVGGQNLRRCS